uniref:Protein kinase domain-containing protein n=1 Tax=Macrostomum lignano TaxID=282301 RepID=A0A1I8I4W3_9PLAT
LGAYGLVCSATVADTGSRVALKRLSDAFANEVVAKRAFREIKILRHLSHPNVISLREFFCSSRSCDVYLVLDYMPMDLNGFLKQRGALAFPDVKYIFYQLMCGLICIHSIAMSRHLTDTAKCSNLNTVYVATRRYRAPELLLKAAQYTTAVDIWSAGCVLGELLIGRPVPRRTNPRHRERHGQAARPAAALASPRLSTREICGQPGQQRLTGQSADEILHGNGNDGTGDFLASLRGTRPEAERLPMLPQLPGLHPAGAAAAAAVPAEASAAATEAAKDAAASSFLQSLLQASPISSELSSSPQISPMSGCAAPPAPGSRDAAASGMSRGQHRCSKLPSEPQPPPQEQLQGPPLQALHVPASTTTAGAPDINLLVSRQFPDQLNQQCSVCGCGFVLDGVTSTGGDDPMLCPDENVVMETETGGFSLAGMLSPSVLELLSGISPMNCDQAMREFRQIWPIQPGDVDELMQLDETSACDAQLD